MNEELLKSLSGAIDVAIQQMVAVDQMSKSDVSLQDAKLRSETANGTLPGDNRDESALKPEDAKKAEDAVEMSEGAKKGDLKIMHEDDCDDKAKKGENPFASKKDKDDDDKDDDKDDDDDDDMDDDKAEKMKAKIKKYEMDKTKKMASPVMKSDAAVADELKKSIVTQVSEVMEKSFGERLSQLEGLIQKLVQAPQPRQSVSGLAPLAKSNDDVQPAGATPAALNKSEVLDKLFAMQKADDKRVDSSVIARVEMNDFSVLSERNINLK